MIWTYLMLFILSAITQMLQSLNLQKVDKLPEILGVDIDTALVNGVSLAHTVFTVFWPLAIMLGGALFLLAYFVLKNIALRTFLGYRAPGTH